MHPTDTMFDVVRDVHPKTMLVAKICLLGLVSFFLILVFVWINNVGSANEVAVRSTLEVFNFPFGVWISLTLYLMIRCTMLLAGNTERIATDKIQFLLVTWLFPLFGILFYFGAILLLRRDR